jgi:hypothetical protein
MLYIFLLWLYRFLHRLLLPWFNIFRSMLYMFLLWLYNIYSCIGSSYLGSMYLSCASSKFSALTIHIVLHKPVCLALFLQRLYIFIFRA